MCFLILVNPALLLLFYRPWNAFAALFRCYPDKENPVLCAEHLLKIPDKVILNINMKMWDFIHLVNYQRCSRTCGPKNILHLLQKEFINSTPRKTNIVKRIEGVDVGKTSEAHTVSIRNNATLWTEVAWTVVTGGPMLFNVT